VGSLERFCRSFMKRGRLCEYPGKVRYVDNDAPAI
jgi:hypothetical protein